MRAVLLSVLLGLALLVLAVFLGSVDLPPDEIAAVLFGQGGDEARLIITELRLPRIATGILAGMHFAVAGALLQAVVHNPIADPTILGISQGATLVVTVFLFLTVYSLHADSNTLYALPTAWLPLAASLGGLFSGGLIYLLAVRTQLTPLRLSLCGIAIGGFLHAMAMGIIVGWGSARLEIIMQWLSGSLYARGWEHVLFLLPFTLLGCVALPFVYRSLTLLRFEETVSRSFGLAYGRSFSLVLALACILAASAVGVVGPLIFVGLMVPHLARGIAGHRFGLMLPLAACLGAALVTGADLAGRLAGGAEEIPIGVVTAFAGAPFLLYLLRRTR